MVLSCVSSYTYRNVVLRERSWSLETGVVLVLAVEGRSLIETHAASVTNSSCPVGVDVRRKRSYIWCLECRWRRILPSVVLASFGDSRGGIGQHRLVGGSKSSPDWVNCRDGGSLVVRYCVSRVIVSYCSILNSIVRTIGEVGYCRLSSIHLVLHRGRLSRYMKLGGWDGE